MSLHYLVKCKNSHFSITLIIGTSVYSSYYLIKLIPAVTISQSCSLYDVRLRSYGMSNLPNFRIFAYFLHTKRLKTYLSVTSLQPRGYIAEWLRFFHVVVKSKKGCLPAVEFSCDIWYGSWEWDPQTCPNFRLWQMAVPIQNFTARCVRSGPNMSENAQFWGRM